jgi:hypothetical protein
MASAVQPLSHARTRTHTQMDAADAPSLVRLLHFMSTLYGAHASSSSPAAAAAGNGSASERPLPPPPIPREWMASLLGASSALLHTYDPPGATAHVYV